jgi:hypothetical protein
MNFSSSWLFARDILRCTVSKTSKLTKMFSEIIKLFLQYTQNDCTFIFGHTKETEIKKCVKCDLNWVLCSGEGSVVWSCLLHWPTLHTTVMISMQATSAGQVGVGGKERQLPTTTYGISSWIDNCPLSPKKISPPLLLSTSDMQTCSTIKIVKIWKP